MDLNQKTRARLTERLEALARRRAELESRLADPDVAADSTRVARLARELGALGPLAALRDRLAHARRRAAEADETLAEAGDDAEMQELAREERADAEREEQAVLEEALNALVADEDGRERNVIVEIRSGTGGEEAGLFAAELMRMYTRYAEKHGWKVELMDQSERDLGGIREVTLAIAGRGVWRRLRFESGGHRVQRVPETESQGRIHTSLATVAVLPEPEEVEVEVSPDDIEMSFMRSSGPGGQKVNKTSSCVRLVHTPTGITVRCQDEKSQRANRNKAMKLLRAKLYELQATQAHDERDAMRRAQVGSGDRTDRIRTYNFPQDRITDHRAGVDVFGIETFMLGDCDRLFDALAEFDRQQRIRAFVEGREDGPPAAS
ncbi:MAG: peptide chain release factor 1 [Candidatus Brocadiaceae bacterium]|nr:peptide chain release factor 1 [Candidatus Brocadiaceae bacterium]